MGYEAKINRALHEAATGPAGVLDCRGRELQVGDEIILDLHGPTFVRVAAIEPVLDPRQPPGMMRIALGALYQFVSAKGQRNPEFIRVQTAEEAGPLAPTKTEDRS